MHKHHLGTPRSVSKNKTMLINSHTVQEVINAFEFVDPAFEPWFKKQYFNQQFTL